MESGEVLVCHLLLHRLAVFFYILCIQQIILIQHLDFHCGDEGLASYHVVNHK